MKQAFIFPDEKKKTFATLRDCLISMRLVPVKSPQKFAGKVVSFSSAIPAAKLFCREVSFHIGKGLRSTKPVRKSENLKNKLEHWIFIDSWEGFLLWKQERCFMVEIISDASKSGWGGIPFFIGGSKKTRDYWCPGCPEDLECSGGIVVKEAKAPLQTLSTFSEGVLNGRVDAFVDNENLLEFLNNEGEGGGGGGGGKEHSIEQRDKRYISLSLEGKHSLKCILRSVRSQ